MSIARSEFKTAGRAGVHRSVRLIALLAAVLADSGAAAQTAVTNGLSRLKLRATATASDGPLKLTNVLSFEQADPTLLAAIGHELVSPVPAIMDAAAAANPTTVTHQQVEKRLADLGVNLSRILLCGAAECKIAPSGGPSPAAVPKAQRLDELPGAISLVAEGAPDDGNIDGPLLRSPSVTNGVVTLADVLRERVQRELRDQGRAEIEFERSGGEFLALTAPPWEFDIRSADRAKLGLREFTVALRRAGRTQRTLKIGANVKVMRRVLVARKPLSVGACIREDDLAAEERLFESTADTGFGEPAALVGQQLQRFVPAGEMLRRGDVKAVDLVQRSRPVTVIGAGGGVALQVTGIALDAGGYGDAVRVRLGESRREQREVRGVVTGIATVRIGAEGA